ncbi:exodeoxyribonuclease V subunit gamma [Thalassotalea sp. M1531]|uniref:RecBCD enzyme subunit RecC n=1 Tax=Thalassotalea algicola TaxID=2716224 RepID=A0A7Y0LC35_9GAMM|nr:exodeoxyribonuclease V subunit gamma [Thalassotalea algicola]NMP31567.1 exodeoxyribonuclease V subunit gamma [Thalassotalea algicola]
MIYLYPANKMENLLALFNKVQQVSPLTLFEQEHVIVQNAGMQHWLNMAIAESRGIAMNIQFSLPAQYLWKLLRSIASDDDVPDQSPYSREVLVWRVFQLLKSDKVLGSESFSKANRYWQSEQGEANQQQKRYQLSLKLADLYEQYLIFRPEWIESWSDGDFNLPQELATHEELSEPFLWQGKLWLMLHQQQPYNPMELLHLASKNIATKTSELPKRISFFGINALAPMWLEFLQQIGQHIDIHFFHLNPCADYWGDIQSEKQLAKQISDWTGSVKDVSEQIGNPLLANWGQQGREFLSLLQNISTINIDVFDEVDAKSSTEQRLLTAIQHDILCLKDTRIEPVILNDDSLTITSCHSAFREIQALHDWLLHQLNQDKNLTPKDILVMCPEIEQYAPFIQAVFTRGWQDIDEHIPPLPCSIADRNAQDADPLIANFVDMLSLPDSRFQITSIIAMLRLEAVQHQFGLNSEDIEQLSYWLEQAAVHWGLNSEHKNQVLGSDNASGVFTWQQGLSKLLKGFAYSDATALVGDELYLPFVEGDSARILGQFMLFLESLSINSKSLNQAKSANEWHQYLTLLVEQFYHPIAEESVSAIHHAIGLLSEFNAQAENHAPLTLPVVREFLSAHFSTPDTGRQFMVGQVTFCSMLPMRSIPFKVIAVLGLNDGEYPRQRQPLAFDLMAMSNPKLGDRSRRGDDRYLFLEALISARQKLYLSYQGRSVQNNKTREPSIILQELFDYLTDGYGWQCELTPNSDIRQMPLQAFSKGNYLSEFPSFDVNWLNLAIGDSLKASEQAKKTKVSNSIVSSSNELTIDIDDLVRFFQHPSKWYAQKVLSIYFEHYQAQLEDTEQFSYDRLASYQLKQQLLEIALGSEEEVAVKVEQALKQAKLSGRFADTPLTDEYFEKWQEDNTIFSETILSEGFVNTNLESFSVILEIGDELTNNPPVDVKISAQLPIVSNKIAYYRSSTAKAKDLFTLYLSNLIVNAAYQQSSIDNDVASTGLYFDTKQQKVSQYAVPPIAESLVLLTKIVEQFLNGQTNALLVSAELAHKIFNSRKFEQAQLENFWFDTNSFSAPITDPYMQFFWPDCPNVEDVISEANPIYQHMYQVMEKVKR